MTEKMYQALDCILLFVNKYINKSKITDILVTDVFDQKVFIMLLFDLRSLKKLNYCQDFQCVFSASRRNVERMTDLVLVKKGIEDSSKFFDWVNCTLRKKSKYINYNVDAIHQRHNWISRAGNNSVPMRWTGSNLVDDLKSIEKHIDYYDVISDSLYQMNLFTHSIYI